MALPQAKDISDFHCVTSWSRMDNEWGGVRFKTIAELAGAILLWQDRPACRRRRSPLHQPKFVYITSYDGYSTNLKLEECLNEDALLVHTWNGIPLPREHGGPVRMITPRQYAWKGSKWIKKIIFLQGR